MKHLIKNSASKSFHYLCQSQTGLISADLVTNTGAYINDDWFPLVFETQFIVIFLLKNTH